ncbi:MAG: class I SAM-dependent methyltransferase [Vicingaceae bacterium]
MNNIECPVCNELAKGPLSSYTVEESASHVCTKERDPNRHQRLKSVLKELWPEGKCSIYQCTNCKFGFGVPFKGGNEAYYKILHEQMGYPKWKWDYDFGLEAISHLKAGKILDIGAGSGYFLSALPKELTKYAIESTPITVKELEKKGIICKSDFITLIEQETAQFDAITIFQVLEHISEFKDVLESCFKLLKPNGKLIITVPNAESMFKQERIIGLADMPPNHINKWTIKSLQIASEQAGLKTVTTEFEPGNFDNFKAKVHMKAIALSQKKVRF